MIKSTTLERYSEWLKTAGAGDRFIHDNHAYTRAEFEAKLHGNVQETINIKEDIEEEDYADVGESNSGTTDKDSGTGISESAE